MAGRNANATDLICKHCQNAIVLETADQHECFIGRSIFLDDSGMLFADETGEQTPAAANNQVWTCGQCKQILESLAKVGLHECFDGDDISIDENNVANLKSHAKEGMSLKADWTKPKILALLSLYESNMHLIDSKTKKKQIWKLVSEQLEAMNIQMSSDQVRWKMNSLIGRWKACKDNNNRTGQAPMKFEYFDRIQEIMDPQRITEAVYTRSSKIPLKDQTSEMNEASKKKEDCMSQTSSSEEAKGKKGSQINVPLSEDGAAVGPSTLGKMSRPKHGTGSKLAKAKVELQNDWAQYLKNTQAERKRKHDENSRLQEEKLQLKRKRIQDREKRDADLVKLERKKLKLLAKLAKKINVEEDTESDES